MRALVLGSTGHIGAHIVRALLAAGHQVRAAYRRERFLFLLNGLPVERVPVDLDTLAGLPEALAGCEWVFHAAGYYPRVTGRRPQALARGVASVRRVLEAVRRAGPARLVFTSSAATIRRVPGRPATEADAKRGPPAEEPGLYAAVKVAMEQEVVRAAGEGLPAVLVNPSVCVGEYDAHAFSGQLLLVFAKRRLPFYLEAGLNAVYTGDVGVGHVRAAQQGRVGERYLLTGCDLSLQAFAAMVAGALGRRPPRWRLPRPAVLTAAWLSELFAGLTGTEPLLSRRTLRETARHERFDGSKARQELALPQTPIEEAIRRALAWFRANGYL